MRTWETLTRTPFTASNGMIVSLVGDTEGLRQMGQELRNGLMIHHEEWGSLCLRGRRQIFKVSDQDGKTLANGECKIVDGKLTLMFVRSYNNRELRRGKPEVTAVTEFVAAVTGEKIPLSLRLGSDRFTLPADQDASAIQRLWNLAKANAWSPFAALIGGPESLALDRDVPTIDPDADPLPDEPDWLALSDAHQDAETKLVIEPVRSRKGLRTLGEELENSLFMFHGNYAIACQDGISQFAAVMSKTGGVIACAELRANAGKVVVATVLGEFDSAPPQNVIEAVDRYVSALNDRRIIPGIAAGRTGFDMDGTKFADEYATLGDADTTRPTMIPGLRALEANNFSPALGGAVFNGFADEEAHDLDDIDPDGEDWIADFGPAPETWAVLTSPFVATNGFTITPLGTRETISEASRALRLGRDEGEEFHDVARRCDAGAAQVVRIDDQDGKTVSLAEVVVRNGEIVRNANFGRDRYAASSDTEDALEAWCNAINNNDPAVTLAGVISDDGFQFGEVPAFRP